MNTIQIGKKFEEEAINILKKEGFKIIENSSKKCWGMIYDFIVTKKNEKYYVEVRGRKNGKYTNNFSITKNKLNNLRNLNENVLILCINDDGYFIFNLNSIKDYTFLLYTQKGTKFYVINKSPINKERFKGICSRCNLKSIYNRFSTKERVCRSCGYIEKIEDDGE